MSGPLSYSLTGYRPRRGRRALAATALAAALAVGAGAGWAARELTGDHVATTPAPTTASSPLASQTAGPHTP